MIYANSEVQNNLHMHSFWLGPTGLVLDLTKVEKFYVQTEKSGHIHWFVPWLLA